MLFHRLAVSVSLTFHPMLRQSPIGLSCIHNAGTYHNVLTWQKVMPYTLHKRQPSTYKYNERLTLLVVRTVHSHASKYMYRQSWPRTLAVDLSITADFLPSDLVMSHVLMLISARRHGTVVSILQSQRLNSIRCKSPPPIPWRIA
jgi:hypothetical protein